MSSISYSKFIRSRISGITEETHKTCKIEILSSKAYLRMFDTKMDGELVEYYNVPVVKSVLL